MVQQVKDIALLVMFLLIFSMTLFWPDHKICPEPTERVVRDTITKVEWIEVPGPTEWKDTIIYKPVPVRTHPTPDQPPAVVNIYSDSLTFDDCTVVYESEVWGEMKSFSLKARRNTSRVLKITSTEYREREVEKKMYPNRFYLGGGLGGSRRMLDDVSVSAMVATKRNAYALDYDIIDQSVKAKVYFKIF
jgi:hypothetical protein